jgi:plastocyanin
MRKILVTGAIAILTLGVVAVPASADQGRHRGHGHEGRRDDNERVTLNDNCDPATFNAAFGAGTCVPHGKKPTVPLPDFLAKLNPVDFGHPAWNNRPSMLDIDADESIKVKVKGGEFHTFTEVPMFGPGCIGLINDALALTGPAPTPVQCGEFFATTGVAANGGSTLTVSGLSPGTHFFMCEIHPWMRTTVMVEGEDEHED